MTTHEVLFSRENNENATSAMYPVAVYDASLHAALLDKTATFCTSADFDMPISAKVYEVLTVTTPDWMSAEEFIREGISWKHLAYQLGSHVFGRLPREELQALKGLDSLSQHVLGKLLAVKGFRSDFRRKMAEQVRQWIATPAEERQFNRPLSVKQFDAIATRYDRIEAQRNAEAAYRANRCREFLGFAGL